MLVVLKLEVAKEEPLDPDVPPLLNMLLPPVGVPPPVPPPPGTLLKNPCANAWLVNSRQASPNNQPRVQQQDSTMGHFSWAEQTHERENRFRVDPPFSDLVGMNTAGQPLVSTILCSPLPPT
jgi:hypothetical protein